MCYAILEQKAKQPSIFFPLEGEPLEGEVKRQKTEFLASITSSPLKYTLKCFYQYKNKGQKSQPKVTSKKEKHLCFFVFIKL